jgi:glycosyltransferase involved in cell wall biosynthesis
MRVSVVVTTFNHERYIAQALDSVLAQEIDGGVEVLVSEDCSTDGTRAILHEYESRHPDTIRLLLSPRNLNSNEVLRRGLEAADGPFIALLDGDDYWTSPRKLDMQVRCLEERPELSMCFHNAQVVYEDPPDTPHAFHLEQPDRALSAPTPSPLSTLTDLLGGNFIQTCSVVLRRDRLPKRLPEWYDDLGLGDWPLYVFLAERGPIAYIDEVLAVYRVHREGHWSAKLSRMQRVADVESIASIYEVLDRHLRFRYTDQLMAGRTAFCGWAAEVMDADGRHQAADEVRQLADGPRRPPDQPGRLRRLARRLIPAFSPSD